MNRTLSDDDVKAIAAAVAKQHSCSLGITTDDAVELCHFAQFLKRLRNAVGNVVIYGLIAFLAVLFYMGVDRWR